MWAWPNYANPPPFTDPARSPSVFPLNTCEECEGQVTFGCFASGFFPQPAEISWVGVASGARNFPEVQTGAGRFGASSQVTMAAAEAEGKTFQCRVGHRGQNFEKEVKACLERTPKLSISLLSDPNQSHLEHPEVFLLCQVRGRGAGDARLTWLVNGDVTDLGAELSTCEEGGAGHEETTTLSGRANVSRALWDSGATFTCRAGHAHLDTPLEANISTYCRAPVPELSVTVLPPSLHDLYLSTHPNLTCVLSNAPSPDGVEFTWSRSVGGANSQVGVATAGPAQRLPNGLYEVRNVLGVCAEDWNSGDAFTCRVRVGGREAGEASARKDTDGRVVAPKVFVFPPPPEDLARAESAILTCLASGFWPRDVLVTWTQQDAPVAPEKFSVLGPEPDAPEGSGTFSVFSKLEVPVEEWKRGDVFGCVVGHEGVEMKFIQRNLDKSMARPANVNVSVILADSDTVCY